jgi:hypothetical protein
MFPCYGGTGKDKGGGFVTVVTSVAICDGEKSRNVGVIAAEAPRLMKHDE